MIRVKDLDQSLHFFCELLGFKEVRRRDSEKGRFTLVFLAAPDDFESATTNQAPTLELTYNWESEEYTGGRNFGHIALEVNDIYQTCSHLQNLSLIHI